MSQTEASLTSQPMPDPEAITEPQTQAETEIVVEPETLEEEAVESSESIDDKENESPDRHVTSLLSRQDAVLDELNRLNDRIEDAIKKLSDERKAELEAFEASIQEGATGQDDVEEGESDEPSTESTIRLPKAA